MKTLTVYMLPGETPYAAIGRVVREIERTFDVDVDLAVSEQMNGTTRVTADFFARVEVTVISEAKWKRIKTRIWKVAERELRKG